MGWGPVRRKLAGSESPKVVSPFRCLGDERQCVLPWLQDSKGASCPYHERARFFRAADAPVALRL